MKLEDLLMSVDPEKWQTRQAIIFDWYDGPRAGVCSLEYPRCEFYYDVLDEIHNEDGLDGRTFLISAIADGSVDRVRDALQTLGGPANSVWVPQYSFSDPSERAHADAVIREVENSRRRADVIISTPDMESFHGCWRPVSVIADAQKFRSASTASLSMAPVLSS